MESLEKVLGEKSWAPNLSSGDRHVKDVDLGSPLMAGVWVVLGGLAIFTLFLAPFLNSSGISSSSLPTPLIPALPGFPGPQSLFLPRPKLKNHEKCGLVGGGKVRTLFLTQIGGGDHQFSMYCVTPTFCPKTGRKTIAFTITELDNLFPYEG